MAVAIGKIRFRLRMMYGYDLTRGHGRERGAKPCATGFEVNEPFGSFVMPELDLSGGWYELVVTGPDASIRLELIEIENFKIIDMAAKSGSSGYMRLTGGKYRPAVYPGVRPGQYTVKSAWLRPLSFMAKARLLGGRLLLALKTGVSLQRLAGLIKLSLSKSQTYGIRSSMQAQDELGVLTAADRQYSDSKDNLRNRLERISHRPVFLISGAEKTDLENQVYRWFTFEESAPHDYIVNIGKAETLTPDALMLFAEYLQKHKSKSVILSDKWICGRPTCHVAWDPIFYANRLPTPNCVRKDAQAIMNFENECDFGIIPVPVARTNIPEVFQDAPVASPKLSMRSPCTIIIPTRDRSDLLRNCLAGLFDNTDWPHEVIVMDNGSVEPETEKLFDEYRPSGLRTIRADIPFNFSTLCNIGVAAASHPFIVLLNNDIVLRRPDWLSEMMSFAIRPQVGAVGARLLYPDGRLQHAGIMLGLTQLCGHLWRGLDSSCQAMEPRIEISSVRSAVTAACLCIEKTKFNLVGGLNEEQFAVTLNDVDLCLRLGQKGLVNVYASQAIAYHHESESRGDDTVNSEKMERRLGELRAFNRAWQDLIDTDRSLPASVSRATELCQLR